MAKLETYKRKEAWAEHMREVSRFRDVTPVNKVELESAMGELDDWLDTNQAGALSAITGAAATSLTDLEKLQLLCDMIRKRYSEGVF